MRNDNALVLLLLNHKIACMTKLGREAWVRTPIQGEQWLPIESGLSAVLRDIESRINRSNRLADFDLYLLYAQDSLCHLSDLPTELAQQECQRWQVLQWEPLRDRTNLLATQPFYETTPGDDWLMQYLLPILESTFCYQDEALSAERERSKHQHEETLATLRAERLRLQNELIAMHKQLTSLQQLPLEQLIAYLPALYRNVFGAIGPHDLALLAGKLQPPDISSPWPEPSSDTLKVLQARLRRLPTLEAEHLRRFCRQLSHKLEVRAEMRDWLGDD